MSWNWNYRPYVPVAERRAKAERHAQALLKKGARLSPVTIEGRTLARTFWGQAWCRHLESFSDYANRLPRGRTYVRNGSVLDLQIEPGTIKAQVMGSRLYHGTVSVAPLKPARWKAIKAECAGKIDSLVGLLQGRLSDAVMRVITDREHGLFPQPSEIKLACSCPDWADLCKHLAAVLYGVGARLDTQPELLFLLRGVDHLELIGAAADSPALTRAGAGDGAMDAEQLSNVFGIEIDPAGATAPPSSASAKRKPVKAAPPAKKTTSSRRTATPQDTKKQKSAKKKPRRSRRTAGRNGRSDV